MVQYLIHYSVADFQSDLKKIVADAVRGALPEERISPEYLTRQQVRDKLHISYPTLNRFNKEGILFSRRIGGRVLYLLSDVEGAIIQDQDQSLKYRRPRQTKKG